MAGLMQSTFKFRPFSRKQKQVLTWWMPESGVSDANGIIADGAIRSGKTVCMALSFVIWSMETFQEQNFAMCGKTVGSFRRNVLAVMKPMLRGRGYQFSDRRSDNLLIVTKGNVKNYYYIFGGKDESSQDLIQGITLAGLLLDEVALMVESFVNQAVARCSVTGSKIWFNCNPAGPRHWFKVKWIDLREKHNLLYLRFTMDDNLSLSEKIKERYRAMFSGVFFRRYILGEWCVAEGLVYPMFDRVENVVNDADGPGDYYIAMDYGTINPTAFGLWRLHNGTATMVKEYYHNSRETNRQKTDEEYYADLVKFAAGFKIKKIIIDPSAASFKETIRRKEAFSVMDAKNDVLDGIRVTSTMIQDRRLKIHSSCKETLREVEEYRWADNPEKDVVIKENDHSMDQMRYLCFTLRGLLNAKGKYNSLWM